MFFETVQYDEPADESPPVDAEPEQAPDSEPARSRRDVPDDAEGAHDVAPPHTPIELDTPSVDMSLGESAGGSTGESGGETGRESADSQPAPEQAVSPTASRELPSTWQVAVLMAFVLAAVALFIVARAGAPRLLLAAVFIGYAVVAICLVVNQYAEARSGRVTLPMKVLVRLMFLGGAGGVLIGVRTDGFANLEPGTWLFGGVLFLYLGAGFAVLRSRAMISRDAARSTALTAARTGPSRRPVEPPPSTGVPADGAGGQKGGPPAWVAWLGKFEGGARAVDGLVTIAHGSADAGFAFGRLVARQLARLMPQWAVRLGRRARSAWGVVARGLRTPLGLCAILVVALRVTLLGLSLLGEVKVGWPLGLIAIGLVGMPWAMSLLAEHAIRAFEEGTTFARFNAGATGAVMVVVGLAVARSMSGSWLAAVALAALALLVVALCSSTLADIAVVLVVVALMGLTSTQDAVAPEATSGSTRVLVVLGDSYMSGEGASTFMEGTDDGATNECRRATTSWAAMSGQLPPFDGVINLSCSGADTDNIRHDNGHKDSDGWKPEPYVQPGEEGTQLDAYEAKEARLHPGEDDELDPSLVVLSVGGNDAGFSTIGLTCLAPHSCNDAEPQALWNDASLARVENRLRQTYDQVDKDFANSPVVVVPYIDPIYGEKQCGQATLEDGDITFLKDFLEKLNKRIYLVATQYGFHYLAPMVSALRDRHLQLCDPDNRGRPGLNFIGLRSVNGLGDQRFNPTKWHHNSLHPNERGHAAMFSVFHRWLADHDLETLPARTSTATPDRTPATDEDQTGVPGKCWTFGDGPNDCRSKSTDWALRQAGEAAVGNSWLVLLVGAGAGLLATALFGGRRSRYRVRLHA